MADPSMHVANPLAARQRSNVDFGSGNAELERVTLAQELPGLLGRNRLPIDRDAVVVAPRSDLHDGHDESVAGKSSAEGPARGGRCHRDDLLNWRPHFTPSSCRVEERAPERAISPPTTLATVKPPRDLRTKIRSVAEMPEVS
ncbi:hypothetical protein [Stenotrophomonas nematodicola]|uniref:Uncharacterized protein n=1 Tax=Stenotrophomonas nematodicola TaxID=2656746 RepID=A0ABW7D2F0_9GAMM